MCLNLFLFSIIFIQLHFFFLTIFLYSSWLCTFSMAVAVGAALLLPVSIASNEVLLLYPNSYYVKWLNSSLIQGKLDCNCCFLEWIWKKFPYSLFDCLILFYKKILFIGLWNHVFLFSNLSLFVFLPFAYLFTESTGFSGHKKGIIPRVYETFTVFSLLAFVVLGLTYVLSAVMDPEKIGFLSLFSKY